MNITGYIVDFLKKGNNVEISGIGTLQIKSIAAQYLTEANTFTPAIKTIEFTAETAGDKKIIDYIAEKECVPKDTAIKMWDNFVLALKEKLQNEGEHIVGNLGVLKFNPIGEIMFSSNQDINLLENTFGLQELTEIKQYDATPLRVNPFDYSSSSAEQNTIPSSDGKVNIVTEKDDEDSPITRRLKEIVQQLEEQEKPIEEETIVSSVIEEKLETIAEETTEPEMVTDELSDSLIEEFTDEPSQEIIENPQPEETKVIEPVEEPVILVETPKEEFIKEENPSKKEPKKKRKGILWLIILLICLLTISAGVYYYFTSIKGTSSDKPKVANTEIADGDITETEEFASNGEYSPYQFFTKDIAAQQQANGQIQENERLYSNGGIFAMNPIEGDLMTAYFGANPDKLPKEAPVIVVEKPVKAKTETKPARRNVNIPIKQKSDYEFDLVAGIFRVKSNAMKHADDIAQYGINPYVVEVSKNGTMFYYVSLGGRKTYTEVEALKANYRNLRGIDMAITKW